MYFILINGNEKTKNLRGIEGGVKEGVFFLECRRKILKSFVGKGGEPPLHSPDPEPSHNFVTALIKFCLMHNWSFASL